MSAKPNPDLSKDLGAADPVDTQVAPADEAALAVVAEASAAVAAAEAVAAAVAAAGEIAGKADILG